MKLVLSIFVLLAGVAAGSLSVNAQSPTRIKFRPGATSAIVSGQLSGRHSSRTYLIKVRQGQTLTTRNAGSRYITVSITPPKGSTYEQDMAADCHDRNEVTPTAAGDYRITVTECEKADPWKVTFKMKVTVR